MYGLINIARWFNAMKEGFEKVNALPLKSP